MVYLYGFIFSTSSRLKWKTSIVRALSSHSRNKSTTDTSLSSWSIALIARPVIIKKCGAMPNKRVSRYKSFFLVPFKLSPQSFSLCTYFYKHELFSGLHRAFIIRPSDLQQPKHPQTFRKRNHRPSGNLGTHTITFQQGMPWQTSIEVSVLFIL